MQFELRSAGSQELMIAYGMKTMEEATSDLEKRSK